jgi:hypothetical protein
MERVIYEKYSLGFCRNWLTCENSSPVTSRLHLLLQMPPRTCSNRETVTRKRQASNVDETANKRPKTNDNESQGKKKKKRPSKTKK